MFVTGISEKPNYYVTAIHLAIQVVWHGLQCFSFSIVFLFLIQTFYVLIVLWNASNYTISVPSYPNSLLYSTLSYVLKQLKKFVLISVYKNIHIHTVIAGCISCMLPDLGKGRCFLKLSLELLVIFLEHMTCDNNGNVMFPGCSFEGMTVSLVP